MYGDVPVLRRKDLKNAELLKEKASIIQKKTPSFSMEHESVRAAREIGLHPEHSPRVNMLNTVSALMPPTEYVSVSVHSALPHVPLGDSPLLLNSPPRDTSSPFVECEISMTPSLEEDGVGSIEDHAVDAAVVAGQPVAVSPKTIDQRALSFQFPLSTGSPRENGELREGIDATGEKADSSIMLNTESDDDNGLVMVEEDNDEGENERDDEFLPHIPTDESLSITMTSVENEESPPMLQPQQNQQPQSEEEADEEENALRIDADYIHNMFTWCGVTGAAASERSSVVEIPRGMTGAGSFGGCSPPIEETCFKRKESAPHTAHPADDTYVVASTATADCSAHPGTANESGHRWSQSPPQWFEQYVQKGQAKRAQLAEEERQMLRKEAKEMRYTPQVSLYAEKRAPRSVSEYIEASEEWERCRRERMKSAALHLAEYEKGERQKAAAMLNVTSERIIKAMEAKNKRVTVTENVEQHAAIRQTRMQDLQDKYMPSFKPSITRVAMRQKKEESQMRHEEGKSFLQGLYERFAGYREASEKNRERLQKLAAERQTSAPKWRRSETEINEHIRAMLERDDTRRKKMQLRVEREREEQEAKIRSMKPHLNRRSAELVEQARQRRSSAAPAVASCAAPPLSHAMSQRSAAESEMEKSPLPAQQQQQQRQRNRGMSTSRKLSYSSSKTRGESCAHASFLWQPTASVISPGFEERNVKLLQKRYQHAERQRQKAEEELAHECTFRPRTNPASRRMAMAHYRQMMHPASAPGTASLRKKTPSENPPRPSGSIENDLEWADFVRQSKRETGDSSRVSSHYSNAPAAVWGSAPVVNREDSHRNRNNSDLALQIESLEAMLSQWKQLEEEYRL